MMVAAAMPAEAAPRQRILALDVGKRRIGVAVSDALGITAQGLPTFHRTTIRDDMSRLAALAASQNAGLFLLGFPLHMSGRESRQSHCVREFGDRLTRHTGIPVENLDERLTTVEANRVLRSSGIGIEKRAAAHAAWTLTRPYAAFTQPALVDIHPGSLWPS